LRLNDMKARSHELRWFRLISKRIELLFQSEPANREMDAELSFDPMVALRHE
jgi:hypothetical protein